MKNPKSQLLLLGLLTLFFAVPLLASGADDWRYAVLAHDQIIKADAITTQTYDAVLEFKAIDVGGFKTARLFVDVMQSNFYKNQGKFTASAKLRVSCFHNIKGASTHFFEKEIPMKVTTYISGWIEIPIIGPDMRVVITGDNLPKTEMKAQCTIYLLK